MTEVSRPVDEAVLDYWYTQKQGLNQ